MKNTNISIRPRKVKTVDVYAKEWFDRVNGNSYFAGKIIVNYGTASCKEYIMPIQYGYDSHYQDMAFKKLQAVGAIPEQAENVRYWRYYDEHGIIYRHSKESNCLKRQLMEYVEPA